MRHDADLLANARVVAADELAQIIDAMIMSRPRGTRRRRHAPRLSLLAAKTLP